MLNRVKEIIQVADMHWIIDGSTLTYVHLEELHLLVDKVCDKLAAYRNWQGAVRLVVSFHKFRNS